MSRKDLLKVKVTLGKRLEVVRFSPVRKGKLPKPLDKLSGANLTATPLYEVSSDVRLAFVAKTAAAREQRQLYGWAFQATEKGLLPLARMDYHPSHKGLHMVLNCERGLDLTNRGLPGCREFALGDVELDADEEKDRIKFVALFCKRLGIELGKAGGLL
ncbi:MAG: hypothetical protein IPP85_11165 [Propionivibrio sp.]|nr:hypothetical protein [Propionivibrio sp.]